MNPATVSTRAGAGINKASVLPSDCMVAIEAAWSAALVPKKELN
jgi:hypothetical protein